MAMTGEQYDALVRLMRGSPESAANKAARLVLVDGLTQAEAVRETGATRSTVSDAVGLVYNVKNSGGKGLRVRC